MIEPTEGFPLRWAILWAIMIGTIYFLPQALHLQRARSAKVLLEENYDEVVYAVWASRAAGEQAGQPDPYNLMGGSSTVASFATAQPLPAFLLGTTARILHLPVTTLFLAGSFLFPALTGLLFFSIAWSCGLRERWLLTLSATFSLLALPPVLWLMQWQYIAALMADIYPGFRLTLPYSRRSQPQFTAILHYSAIAFSLLAIKLKPRLPRHLSGLLAGSAFGLSFYCYYFSWTLLLGWFVIGGIFVWHWHKEFLPVWLMALGTGCAIAIPYLRFLVRYFSEISSSAASARTHTLPQDPAIPVTLLVCAMLVGALWVERERQLWLWPPLVLNLVAVLGALQNVVSGIYIQPYHYLHYFARPTTNLALVILVAWGFYRWRLHERLPRVTQSAIIGAIAVVLVTASVFQWARYREVSSLAEVALSAQPALTALRYYAEPGAVVYCPQATVREAIPLYTKATSFYSLYLLLNENESTRQAVQQRIAGMQWLDGMSSERFSSWLKNRPLEVYFQHLQKGVETQSEEQIRKRGEELRLSFEAIQPQMFTSLRYALMPTATKLNATRLPALFESKELWTDEHYSLFALTLK